MGTSWKEFVDARSGTSIAASSRPIGHGCLESSLYHLLSIAVGIHRVQFVSARAVRSEDNVTSVMRPARALVVAGVLREAQHTARSDVQHEDIEATLDAAGVGELVAGGRPGGGVVVFAVVGHAAHVGPLGVHDPDVRTPAAVGGEGDLAAGGGPRGAGVGAAAVSDLARAPRGHVQD